METNDNSSNGSSGDVQPIPGLTATPQGSLESLSEYTDAHEDTASAPTEFLAEFLSAIMIKDYDTALKYCKLILQYEPHNATAKELYPLLVEKIQLCADDANSEDSSSSGGGGSDGTTASYSSLEDEEAEYENGNVQRLCMHADQQNGNASFLSSSEESSPTEPVSQALTQPLGQLHL